MIQSAPTIPKIIIPSKKSYSSSDDYSSDDKLIFVMNKSRDLELGGVSPKISLSSLSKEPKSSDRQSWNNNIMLFLKKISEKALGFKYMHSQNKSYCEKQNSKFSKYEIIFFSILSALTSGEFVGVVSDSNLRENVLFVGIITGCQIILLIILGIIRGFKEDGDYKSEAWRHKYTSSKFNEISFDIQKQFLMDIRDRQSDRDFVGNIIKTYNQLMESAPSIEDDIMKKYMSATQDSNIARPLIIGDFNDISMEVQVDHIDENDHSENKEKYLFEMRRFLRNY